MKQSIIGVERLGCTKVLGVTLSGSQRGKWQLANAHESCSRSLYVLRIMRLHGMPTAALHKVTRATTMTQLLYVAHAW